MRRPGCGFPTVSIVLTLLAVGSRPCVADGAYGLGTQLTSVPTAAFRPASSADQFTEVVATVTPASNAPTTFVAPILLPNGAILQEVRFLIVDIDDALDVSASVRTFGQSIGGSQTCGGELWSGTSATFFGRDILTVTGPPILIQSRGSCSAGDSYTQYYLQVELASTSQSLSGAVLVWHRSMSPAPAAATFDDVPTSDPFFQAIEALAASTITSGCGGNNFCPNDPVTRSQMAKFLANALGLHFPE